MKVEVELDLDQLDEIIRQDLIKSYQTSLSFGRDEEVTEALKTVIMHYSNRYQQEEFLEEFAK